MLQGSHAALFLQTGILDMVSHGTVFTYAVLGILACFSILSLTIAFSKWSAFSGAARSDSRFARAFRKSNSLETVVAAAESFRPTPLVRIFDTGYAEASRQMNSHRRLNNKEAISRSLQVAISEQLSRFEHNLNWLATIASVSPFIGLFGTVMGIVRVFNNLGGAGGPSSITSVGPGVADALVTTGVGLIAAIPAAIFYNVFGRRLKEMGDRFDNFSLEFINMVERSTGE
jgi:biopolymer transport protein TolQ